MRVNSEGHERGIVTEPLLSVIIPVGPAHRLHCRQAVASALNQTVAPWGVEVIVCPDADTAIAPMHGVTILDAPGHRTGPAATRNRGIAVASGAFVIFLDADDYLLPTSAEIFLRRYAWGDAAYVYGDAYTVNRAGEISWARSRDYIQEHQAQYNIHTVTALALLSDVKAVGGFDEGVDAWEDWTLWLRLAMAGRCGARTPLPTFVYRMHEGERMTRWYGTAEGSTGQQEIIARYEKNGIIAMSTCCGGSSNAVAKAKQVVGALGASAPQSDSEGRVLVQFTGAQTGSVPIRAPSGNTYKFGNNAANRNGYVAQEDLAWLQERVSLQIVPQPPKPTPPPEPAKQTSGPVTTRPTPTPPDPAVMDALFAEAEEAISKDNRVAVGTPAESHSPRRGHRKDGSNDA